MKLNKAWEALKRTVIGPESPPATARTTITSVPDGFPLDASSPHFATHRAINDFYAATPEPRMARHIKPGQHPVIRAILEAPQPERFLALEAILARRIWLECTFCAQGSMEAPVCEFRDVLRNLTLLLYRGNPCSTQEHAATPVSMVAGIIKQAGIWNFEKDIPPLLKVCEEFLREGEVSRKLMDALYSLHGALSQEGDFESADRRRMKATITRLLNSGSTPQSSSVPLPRSRKAQSLDARDLWAAPINEFLASLETSQGGLWDDLIVYARTATASKPSGKWLKQADSLLEAVGRDNFREKIVEWFQGVRPTVRTSRFLGLPEPPMNEQNAEVLKGLVWCCCHFEDSATIHAVSNLAQACFKKVPAFGPLSAKVGNACLQTLSHLPGFEPVAQLSRLRIKVKYVVALRLIDRALEEAAAKLALTTEELEEIAVPTYGLDEHGCLREDFGEFSAELKIVGTDNTDLRWFNRDGKAQKSVPAEVKQSCADELKELKRTIQDIEKMLPAQRDRVERILIQEREWEYEKWLEHYHNHPLIAGLSRRLIWHFRDAKNSTAAIWHEGHFVDSADHPVEWLSSTAHVRLWHPLGSEISAVSAWRAWLERHQVTQPFKQAHREIYVLTDAEQQTATYSNRFAAHILRQHQFAAIARQRGWKYTLQGAFDSHNTPSLALPRYDSIAEFFVDGVSGNHSTSEMGIFLHVSTDQVRFCDLSGMPRPLTEVPALVFSEVMRDVDLFVAVCSVGNDPTWADSGEAGPYGLYWRTVSFGELSETAKTRREVLERLLPRLKIAGQCRLEERFLIVRGSLRTYKIHIGSGNIQMEPNNQYLCIVPDRSSLQSRPVNDIFLPFEGDSILAVILSKAFLLAEDSRIKDQTIIRQMTAC